MKIRLVHPFFHLKDRKHKDRIYQALAVIIRGHLINKANVYMSTYMCGSYLLTI